MDYVYIQLNDAPNLPGLRFRQFAGESDYPAMAEVMNILSTHQGAAAWWNPHTLGLMDGYVHGFDPPRDRIMVEMDGKLIGMARVQSEKQVDGKHVFSHSCNLLPEWRGKGIEPAIVHHNENRLREIASTKPIDGPRFLHSFGAPETNPELKEVLAHEGYKPIRHSYEMLRPDLENIPDAPLPDGIEARPVIESEARKIWDAAREAFRDHWGCVEWHEESFDQWKNNPDWDWNISRIAWAGEECAGMVLVFIPRTHNERNAKKRADTECICVRRPWRKKGLATALISRCLHALRDAGYHEAALGVDTENTSGALRIYERMGYRPVQKYTRFEKVMGY